MNTPINFEIAKLLKEKGFPFSQKETYYNPVNGFTSYEEIKPTIAEVIMWLYEKHGIWISVSMENNEEDKISFYFSITENVNNETYFRIRKSNFNSPTEAYEAAIEYTLNNLI